MPLNPDAVGVQGQRRTVTWTSKDALLYAVGIGAGERDLRFSTENSLNCGQVVFPTFPVVFLVSEDPAASAQSQIGTFNPTMVVHGGQGVTVHRPIPTEGSAAIIDRVVAMYDKGKSAVVVTDAEACLESGEPLWTLRTTTVFRGEGGWGGERGPSGSRNEPPERAPDHEVVMRTSKDQAYLYRLNGDRNPLHSDPAFARKAGFERPILHGLCTYGFTARALLRELCDDDASRFGHIEGRFSTPVFPGDQLTVRMWKVPGGAVFMSSVADRTVIDQGLVRYAA